MARDMYLNCNLMTGYHLEQLVLMVDDFPFIPKEVAIQYNQEVIMYFLLQSFCVGRGECGNEHGNFKRLKEDKVELKV